MIFKHTKIYEHSTHTHTHIHTHTHTQIYIYMHVSVCAFGDTRFRDPH